jgi:hypothetical protein
VTAKRGGFPSVPGSGFDVTGEPPALKAGCEGLPAGFKHNNAGKVEATLCPDGVQRTDNEAISTWGGQWNRCPTGCRTCHTVEGRGDSMVWRIGSCYIPLAARGG